MRIKWTDHHGGAVKNERWENISSSRAMALLKRNTTPDDYGLFKLQLDFGEEVHTKNFALKKEA